MWPSWNDAWQGTYPVGFFVLKCHTGITFSFLVCLAECVSVFVVTVRDHNTWSGSVWVLSAESFYLTSRIQIFESPAINSFVARFHEKNTFLAFSSQCCYFSERVSHSCVGHAWCSAVNKHPLQTSAHQWKSAAIAAGNTTFLCRPLLGRNWDRMGFQNLFWEYGMTFGGVPSSKGLLWSTRVGRGSWRRRSCTDHATSLWFDGPYVHFRLFRRGTEPTAFARSLQEFVTSQPCPLAQHVVNVPSAPWAVLFPCFSLGCCLSL